MECGDGAEQGERPNHEERDMSYSDQIEPQGQRRTKTKTQPQNNFDLGAFEGYVGYLGAAFDLHVGAY